MCISKLDKTTQDYMLIEVYVAKKYRVSQNTCIIENPVIKSIYLISAILVQDRIKFSQQSTILVWFEIWIAAYVQSCKSNSAIKKLENLLKFWENL